MLVVVGDRVRMRGCGSIVTVEEVHYSDVGGGFVSFWSSELINGWYNTRHGTRKKNYHNASDVYIEILEHNTLLPLKRMRAFNLV